MSSMIEKDPEFYRGKACPMSIQHNFQLRPDNVVRCTKCWMPWSTFIKGW